MRKQSGQAAITMTLSLLVLSGTLGFVTDLGWGYYKQQSAAGRGLCGRPRRRRLRHGQRLDLRNRRRHLLQHARQLCQRVGDKLLQYRLPICCRQRLHRRLQWRSSVSLTSGGAGSPPGSPGVTVNYWVSANVTQSLFQTFSAVLGNKSLHNIGIFRNRRLPGRTQRRNHLRPRSRLRHGNH